MKSLFPILALALLAACQNSSTTVTVIESGGNAKGFMADSADFNRRFPEIATFNYKTKTVNGEMTEGFRLQAVVNVKDSTWASKTIADSIMAYIRREPHFDKKERYVVEITYGTMGTHKYKY